MPTVCAAKAGYPTKNVDDACPNPRGLPSAAQILMGGAEPDGRLPPEAPADPGARSRLGCRSAAEQAGVRLPLAGEKRD